MSQLNSTSDEPAGILVHKPGTSIFTVLLIISTVAIGIGCLFLLLEISRYGPIWSFPWNVRG